MFLTRDPIIPGVFFSRVLDPTCGAAATFVGAVRNHHEGKPVHELCYECYEVMAERQLAHIADDVKKKYGVFSVRISHRVGWLQIGDVAVAIEVSSAHRDEAFRACRDVIEQIKVSVPIWKKEVYADGTSEWVICTHQHQEIS
ncbi:MAG: molybdenum cofactor biosynthesis protein MoaE [Candidatus Omnitrophota bacterium]|nr:molybdenum cofactor biosynthesis protein MoaE [Candidatus Omnitrophota bacterium]